jgi:hypothetical protein
MPPDFKQAGFTDSLVDECAERAAAALKQAVKPQLTKLNYAAGAIVALVAYWVLVKK